MAWIAAAWPALLVGLVLSSYPGLASAEPALRIAGFAKPGGTLNLPLAHGTSPVTIHVELGVPAVSLPIEIAPSTRIESATGLPVTLTDGDRVKIDAVITDGVIRATTLELEEFPEVEVRGTASGLPTSGVTLPLPAGTTVDFTVTLVPGVNVPVVLTADTKAEHHPTPLTNGVTVKLEAVVRNGQLVVTEIFVEGK